MGVISDSCILSIYILHLLKVFTAHIEGYAGVTANVSRSKKPKFQIHDSCPPLEILRVLEKLKLKSVHENVL